MALRWGIIGLGNIANQFIKDLLLLPHTKVTAVASRSHAKAKAFAELYQVDHFYGDYQAILEDAEVDIVYIATPHNSHMDWCIRAILAGKHVLCEKPLAVNAGQILKLINVARMTGVFIMEAFWSRFNPSIENCLGQVENGTIGTVNYINADFSFYREDPDDSRMLSLELAGGSLLDMGVYPVFLAYLMLGMPAEIKALGWKHTTGVDMQTAIVLKYPKAVAMLMSGFASQSDMVAKIYGTEGRIYLEPYWHETQGYILVEGNDNNTKTTKFDHPTTGKGFTYEIEECIRCIQSGQKQSQKWSLKNSLDLITITDEIRKQAGVDYPFE